MSLHPPPELLQPYLLGLVPDLDRVTTGRKFDDGSMELSEDFTRLWKRFRLLPLLKPPQQTQQSEHRSSGDHRPPRFRIPRVPGTRTDVLAALVLQGDEPIKGQVEI